MSIVSHETFAAVGTEADGTRRVTHHFVNHLGGVYDKRERMAGTDTETEYLTRRLELIPTAEKYFANIELSQAYSAASTGQSPERVAEHQTQAEFDRRLLGRLMIDPDIYTFHAAQPFWSAVQARGGANANQRAAYLGVSRANYDLIANRFGDDQGAAFFIDNAKGQVWSEIPAEFE